MSYKTDEDMRFICGIVLAITLLFPRLSLAQERNETISPFEYFLEGVKYFNEGNYENAKELLIRTIEANSENDAAYYYLALIYLQQQDPEGCEAYLKKAQEIDPGNFWYKIRLAQFYADRGDLYDAIALYENVAKDHPAKNSIYYEIIDLYTASQQYDKALETLDKIESVKGENEATGEVRYELLLRQGRYQDALSHLEEYFESYPSARVAMVLGDLNKSMYKDSIATSYYRRSIELDPSYSPAHLSLAEMCRVNMNYPDYFNHINVFMKDSDIKTDIKARYMKEMVITPHFVRQYMPQIDTMVNNSMAAHPKDTAILYMSGAYYIQTGRDSIGEGIFHNIAQSNPQDYRANMEYISLLYYMKNWDSLAVQLERSLIQFPDDPAFTDLLPVAYWQSGDIDKAIDQYDKIIRSHSPKDTLLYTYYSALGDLYHEKGNSGKSYSYYQKALKIKPDYNPVLNNYAYYLCLEGKSLKKAAQMSKKTILTEPDNPTYLDTYAWILYNLGEYQEAKIHIKRAMIYGGNEEPTLLDHYAEILFALGEYDLAFIYWDRADNMDPTLGIKKKIAERKTQMKSK